MIHPMLQTPFDVRQELAARVKARRLELNMAQVELAERAGVSLSSLRRFETRGEISLRSFLELAFVLGELKEISRLFAFPPKPARMLAPAGRNVLQ